MKKMLVVLISIIGVAGCSEPSDTIAFEMKQSDYEHTEAIKDAASVLSQLCPSAKKADSINASYQLDVINNQSGMLGYRSEDYGWNYNVQFQVRDKSTGHNHWIYIGGNDDVINGFLIAGKQESLDFCKINAKMNNNFYMAISANK